ncbi:MAG TPA: C4-type zinc ribbon domain-containing protein [Rhabdochlamydiaceae bacterium]|nr:C4-type zinc ribbon domain-containing protein [Rhabdochlamydiaceae bacterium]
MKERLKLILEIQELDMKMIRLMRIKRERQRELGQIEALRKELHQQLTDKEKEITELNTSIQSLEKKIEEIVEKLKTLESRQSQIKKVEEFNALTQEMTASEREKISIEQKVSDLVDRRVTEEELLEKIKKSLKTSEESSLALENEIQSSIKLINEEGSQLKAQRDVLATSADPEILAIYERLLRNKKDRVVVPVENRTCSGCHIVLTAQHENLVRKGENLIFCEHCSRIHYWQETEVPEGEAGTSPKRRRRRMVGA